MTIMKFKRNLTLSFAYFMNELYISLIPAIFIIGLSWNLATIIDLCKVALCVIIIVIPIFNILMYLLNLVLSLYQKTTIILNDEYIIIEAGGELSTVYYKNIANIYLHLGELSRTHYRPVELEICSEDNKTVLDITNPSLIMVYLINKKCPFAKITYYNSKRTLYVLGISVLTAIFIVICEYFGVSLI